jgi:hypothetical protein
MAYIDVEIEMCDFDTDELIEELSDRVLSESEIRDLRDILYDNTPPPNSLFSKTLLGEQVYNALAELVKSKNELELLELFDKAK